MQYVSIHEAKTHLSRLIKEIEAGKEIVITNNGKPVATLTAPSKPKKRILGDLEHLAHLYPIPADFDVAMPDEWFFPDEDKFDR